MLAKQLASVDSIAVGRLTVGIAVGGREDDYDSTGTPFHERGALFDQQLAEMARSGTRNLAASPAPSAPHPPDPAARRRRWAARATPPIDE